MTSRRTAAFFLVFALLFCGCGPPNVNGPLPQEAYLWQRAWTPSVAHALAEHSTNFAQIVVLGAEISWNELKPVIARSHIDFAALSKARCPLGIALRVGPYQGPFSQTNGPAAAVLGAAKSLLAECASNQVTIAEFQIDFDCAASKLAGYQEWLKAVRRELGTIPLVFTALPSWLRKSGFHRLVEASDGFVLQVHSLDRPKDANASFTLCDPNAARKAVERASRFGKPFRVALPTYGYTVAFDQHDRFIGLSAEGPERLWPEGAKTRDIRSEPEAMAALVRDWSQSHPATLAGIIWYRLPVASDVLNWSWPTLAAVMKGRNPAEHVRVESEQPKNGLMEIVLTNDGEKGITILPAFELVWKGGRLIASDGLAGYELHTRQTNSAELIPRHSAELKPGEKRKIGWLRLNATEPILTIRKIQLNSPRETGSEI